MFRNLSYVGIAVHDAAAAAREWSERYGLEPIRTVISEVEGVKSVFLASPGAGDDQARIELVQPLDPEDQTNPVARRLAGGEGVMQLAFAVDDPAQAIHVLAERGVRAAPAPEYAEGAGTRAIVGPRSANGVVLELVDAAATRRMLSQSTTR